MRKTCGFSVQSFILTATLFAGLGFIDHAAAQERSYLIDLNSRTVTQLGDLGGGFTKAYGLNDSGQVAGSSNNSAGTQRAFITGPDGVGMTDLGTPSANSRSEAYGINNAGQVVGYSVTPEGAPRAFMTGPGGMGIRDLFGGYAQDINEAGQVVGATGDAFHAFITGPNGIGVKDLGYLEGNQSAAFGVNDRGEVVGWTPVSGNSHAFITDPGGANMRDLGTLGGSFSHANGINGAGEVVGFSSKDDSGQGAFAFITGPGGVGMRDLGTLGRNFSVANDINEAGQVVGFSATPIDGLDHAFITNPDGTGMIDLNSLVDVPGGAILTQAMDINNMGQVIALGIPEPESFVMLLAGLGLIGFIVHGKRQVIV